MTDFCHIAPIANQEQLISGRPAYLSLAHLVEQSDTYANFFASRNTGGFDPSINIMDNSAFEMYKEGKPMLESDQLMYLGQLCNADYIVMSDYPNEPFQKTIMKAYDMHKSLHKEQFGTFFVPQSEIGDIDGLIESFLWAVDNRDIVDYIGFSILAIPNAYGFEQTNKMQRFVCRAMFMDRLERHGFFQKAEARGTKLHLLGMVDGPNEIILLQRWLRYFDTWDSSAAVWAGLEGVQFDETPTGLHSGKLSLPVDFFRETTDSARLKLAKSNMDYIDNLLLRCS